MAAKTAADRPRIYKESALKDPEGTMLTRVQTMLDPHAAANLARICKQTGWTRRQAMETTINELARALQCNDKD